MLRLVGFCLNERAYSLGIRSTKHVIELVFVETNEWSVVIQTWSWRGKPAALEQGCGKQTPSASILFFLRIWHVFLISKCREESDLGLCMNSILAKRMPLRSADIRFKNVFGRRIRRKSVLRSGILFASHAQKSARGVCFPQPCSSDGRRFAASRSRLNYYRISGSFQQERIRWNAL